MKQEAMSCVGTITHIRRAPKRHVFRYKLWMLYVPLEQVDETTRFWHRLLASVDRGHLLREDEIRAKLVSAGLSEGHSEGFRIFALTQPRSLGYSFNPVNFYFCFVEERLKALVAHVNNTPWDENHCYVLRPLASKYDEGSWSCRFAKQFHVSPFLPMDGSYDLRLKVSDKRLHIAIRFDGDVAPFTAHLALRTRALTRAELVRCALRRPAQSMLTMARIYWQAVRLFVKRTPFHSHPGLAISGQEERRNSQQKPQKSPSTEQPGALRRALKENRR